MSLKSDSAIESAPGPVVDLLGIRKQYGERAALNGISFKIYSGEIFGLIGADGAGKTTACHILGGLLEPTSGAVSVLGRKPAKARSDMVLGYLTQQFSLYTDLSVTENLRYIAGLRKVSAEEFEERSRKYLRLMNLEPFADRLAGKLSGGMKQKLALCCSLLARPKLLLLDEPTTGVDPVSRREFWDLLTTVKQDDVTIVVATPYFHEAERCTRVALLHEGEVQDIGSPQELRQRRSLSRIEVRGPQLYRIEKGLTQQVDGKSICDVQALGDKLDVLTSDLKAAEDILTQLGAGAAGDKATKLSVQEPTLENVFLQKLKEKTSIHKSNLFPFVATEPKHPDERAISASKVSRYFDAFIAVKDVSMNVDYGQIYGLLGPNGAGKTTTIKMLCGLLEPSAGEVILSGERGDLRSKHLRQRLGYMSQKFTLYDDLTVLENLEYYCGVYCVSEQLTRERISWVLESSGLFGKEKLLTRDLPGGWKQRLAFGAAVLHQPQVLFLDEPTSGVDPLSRQQLWKTIREFANQGTAIVVSTHFLDEAEHCNYLGFMVAGQLVAQGSPGSIKDAQPGRLVEFTLDETEVAYRQLKELFPPWRLSLFGNKLHFVAEQPDSDIPKALSAITSAEMKSVTMRELPLSLEDAFVNIVQKNWTTGVMG